LRRGKPAERCFIKHARRQRARPFLPPASGVRWYGNRPPQTAQRRPERNKNRPAAGAMYGASNLGEPRGRQWRVLRCWRGSVGYPAFEKLRDGGPTSLRWRERLGQHDAVGETPLEPQSSALSPANIKQPGNGRIDFFLWHGGATSPNRPILPCPRFYVSVTSARYFCGKRSSSSTAFSPDDTITSSNPPLGEGVFNDALNELVVFNDEDNR